jgi:hypothetical protein
MRTTNRGLFEAPWSEDYREFETNAGSYDQMQGSRSIEPIRRRKPRSPDDEPLVPGGIPEGRLGNHTFPTATEARQAAMREANRLNRAISPGHSVARSDAHRAGELPHYHVINPQGQQISGHFFYGRKPYRVEPGRDGNSQKTTAAAMQDLNPHLLGWEEERQRLRAKLNSGQATRQEKGRLKWLNHKLGQSIIQQQKRNAQRLGNEVFQARRSKRKARQERESELGQRSQWLFEAPFLRETDAYVATRQGRITFKGGWKRYSSLDAAINASQDKVPGVYKVFDQGKPVYIGEGKIRSELVAFRRHYELSGKSTQNVTVMVGYINNPTKKRLETTEQVLIRQENKKLAKQGKRPLRNTSSTAPFRVPKGKTLKVQLPNQKKPTVYRPGKLHEFYIDRL